MPMRADSELTWDHSSSSSSVVGGLANPFSLSLSPSLFASAFYGRSPLLPLHPPCTVTVVGPVCRP